MAKQKGPETFTLNGRVITSVYSGRARACYCGCRGKHYYATATRAEVGNARGYEVTDDELSDKMVRRVIRIILQSQALNTGDNHFSAEIDGRVYIAYWG